jgi:hypothetical protein
MVVEQLQWNKICLRFASAAGTENEMYECMVLTVKNKTFKLNRVKK